MAKRLQQPFRVVSANTPSPEALDRLERIKQRLREEYEDPQRYERERAWERQYKALLDD